MPNLLDDVTQALQEAAATPLGQKALRGHDEDYDIEVAGHEPFHVAIEGGQMAVRPGRSPHREALAVSGVELGESTLRDILAGRVSPYEAMGTGKLFLLTRLYGGGQITILLRAAYDMSRQRALERGLATGAGGSG